MSYSRLTRAGAVAFLVASPADGQADPPLPPPPPPLAITFHVTVPESPAAAFARWTSEDQAREFLAFDLRIEPWVGGKFVQIFDPENDPTGERTGTKGSTVLVFDPPHRLVFESNNYTPPTAARAVGEEPIYMTSRVEVRFEQVGPDQTQIALRHYGFADGPHQRAAVAYYRELGWPSIVKRLEAVYAARGNR